MKCSLKYSYIFSRRERDRERVNIIGELTSSNPLVLTNKTKVKKKERVITTKQGRMEATRQNKGEKTSNAHDLRMEKCSRFIGKRGSDFVFGRKYNLP